MEYELRITYKCNWDCEYCCVDTHNQPEPDNIFNLIKKIPDNSPVTLSGGEPGVLSKNQLEEIMDTLFQKNCQLGINTNGLFIKKYPDLMDKYISNINYHVTQDLDIDDEIIEIDNKSIEVNHLIIVHDRNFHKLDSFLKKYPDRKFSIIAATNPESGIKNAPELSKKNRILILKHYYKRLTECSLKRLIKERSFNDIIYL